MRNTMNHEQILTALRTIELKHDCRVLYACESGSRAWGFSGGKICQRPLHDRVEL